MWMWKKGVWTLEKFEASSCSVIPSMLQIFMRDLTCYSQPNKEIKLHIKLQIALKNVSHSLKRFILYVKVLE